MSHNAPHAQHKPVSLFSRGARICTQPKSQMPVLINEVGGTLTGVTGLANTYQPST